jgi:hypothetical protein
MGQGINPEDETTYTTQYQKDFLKYVENEYWAKHRRMPVIKPKSVSSSNLVTSSMSSGSRQSSFDPYDLSSNDEEYMTSNNVAEMTPGRSHRDVLILIPARP